MFTFLPLQLHHFSLLQKWLNNSHLVTTWNEGKTWSLEDIKKKYLSYTKGYKEETLLKKPIHAFIIELQDTPIGYIQYYNAYDFPRETGPLVIQMGFPSSLAALDLYIGEPEYLGKGYGSLIIHEFLELYVWPKFKACFVDPNLDNKIAIRAYEKAGFRPLNTLKAEKTLWMLLEKTS